MSFAAYRAAVDLFPIDKPLFDSLMTQLGYDPSNTAINTTTPAGVGNAAARAVLAFRHHDGPNQTGELHAGAYSDYTGYTPVNEPMLVTAPFDSTKVHDVNRWQQLSYIDAHGNLVTPNFVGAQWATWRRSGCSPRPRTGRCSVPR
jgi:hypothetical protein